MQNTNYTKYVMSCITIIQRVLRSKVQPMYGVATVAILYFLMLSKLYVAIVEGVWKKVTVA